MPYREVGSPESNGGNIGLVLSMRANPNFESERRKGRRVWGQMQMLENGHRIHDKEGEQKKCSTCGFWVNILDTSSQPMFSKRKVSKDGLSYSCKPCERKTAMKSYKGQKTAKKAHQRYEENREKVLDRSRENYVKNRDARLDQSRAYRKANPDVYRKADAKRRDTIKAAESDGITNEQIIQRDSERHVNKAGDEQLVPMCGICHKPIWIREELEIDHIVPLAAGGSDKADNKRCSHHDCNIKRPKDGRDLK